MKQKEPKFTRCVYCGERLTPRNNTFKPNYCNYCVTQVSQGKPGMWRTTHPRLEDYK